MGIDFRGGQDPTVPKQYKYSSQQEIIPGHDLKVVHIYEYSYVVLEEVVQDM